MVRRRLYFKVIYFIIHASVYGRNKLHYIPFPFKIPFYFYSEIIFLMCETTKWDIPDDKAGNR